jgi:twitching motility protein PilT
VLVNNPAIANLIRNEKIHQIHNILQTSRDQGMMTLEASIKELVQSGVILREIAEPFLQESMS